MSSKQDDAIKSQVRDAQERAEQKYAALEADKAERLAALKLKAIKEFGYTPGASGSSHAMPQQTQQDDTPMEDAASNNISATATTEVTENAEANLVSPHKASPSVEMKSTEMDDKPEEAPESADEAKGQQVPQAGQSDDHHDDRDIMIETEEDAVIY